MATDTFDRLSLTGDYTPGSPERRGWDLSTLELLRKAHKGISAENLDSLDQKLKVLDRRNTGSVITLKLGEKEICFLSV